MARVAACVVLLLCLAGSLADAKIFAPSPYAAAKKLNLKMLLLALKEIKFDRTLRNPNWQGTIFIPTDQAFKLAQQNNPNGGSPDITKKVVSYHIVPKRVLGRTQLRTLSSLRTALPGGKLTIIKRPLSVMGSDLGQPGRIIKTVRTNKAYIHVIDHVAIPPINLIFGKK